MREVLGRCKGAAIEAAWVAAHIATYPIGLTRERRRTPASRFTLDGLAPVQRGLLIGDVEAAGTPIVLVHGWVDNRSIFTRLRRQLRRRGFGRVVTMNYSIVTHDVPRAARRLAALVERVCEETGYERVHIVGHSMGGLVGRYYVQRLGGDARVHTLATLGTPHNGTRAAYLSPGRATKQMRPGSPLLHELAAPAPGCATRFVSVWSDLDQLVIPARSGCLEHPDLVVRNVLVRGVGHLTLPIHGRVIHELVSTLAHLGADGSTIVAGATPIAAAAPSRTGPPKIRRHDTLRQRSYGSP